MSARFLLIILSCLLFFIASPVFAGFAIHVSGEVRSYKKGIYKIQTKQGLVSIRASKLTASLKKQLKKKVGRRVQLGIPSAAIISYQKK